MHTVQPFDRYTTEVSSDKRPHIHPYRFLRVSRHYTQTRLRQLEILAESLQIAKALVLRPEER